MTFVFLSASVNKALWVRIGFRRFRARFPVIHDEQEGAQADADGAEVGPFVDFQQCMDFMALSQDFLYLVGDEMASGGRSRGG